MSTLRSRVREFAWLAPGGILAAVAAIFWGARDSCDRGGCAVGVVMAMVVLAIAWPIAAVVCSKVAAWLSEKRRLNLFTFVAAVSAAGVVPCVPMVAVSLWSRFLLPESLFVLIFSLATGSAIAIVWWALRIGFAFTSNVTALSPNKSLERTRDR